MTAIESDYKELEDGTQFVRITDSESDGWLEYRTSISIDAADWE